MSNKWVQKGLWLRVAIPLALAGLALCGGWWLLTTPATAQGGQPPSSLELIEKAYLGGELDYETALLYKVYSVFAPDRLPAEFQSDTPSRGATLVVAEVMNAWDSLSMETKILLREFGLGVPLPGEVVPLAQSRPTLNGEEIYDTTHFRIHYTQLDGDADEIPSDDDNANGTPDYLEWVAEAVENVWDTEITTMGWLQPPPDTGEGGDTRYDVYLKNCWPYYGYVNYSDGFVGDNPNSPTVTETDAYYSYMVLENDFKFQSSPQNDIKVTVAHEFNHAIQVGYDGTEETWLMESTATWIEDEVYDDINDNYQFLDKLFQEPDMALDTTFTSYAYSRWIFMRYISEHYGQATVRRIWEHAVTQDNMDTVELALLEAGTDFATLFPRFTAANYVLSDLAPNAPYDYEEADGYKGAISGGAIETEAIVPFNGTSLTYNSFTDGNGRLEHRSAEYIEVESTVNFQVTFESHDSTDFVVQGALRHSDGRVTIKQVSLSGGQGTWVVTDPATYDEVVVVVTNRGDTDETAGYDLTFQTTSETPPTASFTADPISGTIDTVFNFNASDSEDTQTPASQLEVRWDWDGDWVWDTDWSTIKTATHSYEQPGTYPVAVEVRDGVDLRDVATRTVTVLNTQPQAAFSVLPTVGITSTVFQFDASASSDYETPSTSLEVRWDWENDGGWDTEYSTVKEVTHTYGVSDTYTIVLEVRDGQGLTDTTTRTVTVQATGSPPTATFTVSPSEGYTDTVFSFDASACEDDTTPSAELQVRWDWENDGIFDTGWSTDKVATHTFNTAAVYTVALLVKDGEGLEGGFTRTVQVNEVEQSPGDYFVYIPIVLKVYPANQ